MTAKLRKGGIEDVCHAHNQMAGNVFFAAGNDSPLLNHWLA